MTAIPQSLGLSIPGMSGAVATGSTQSDAFQITTQEIEFATVASGTGARLPTPSGSAVTIYNQGANALLVYPASGDQIDANGVNAAVSIPAGGASTFTSFEGPLSAAPRTWRQSAAATGGGSAGAAGTVQASDGAGGFQTTSMVDTGSGVEVGGPGGPSGSVGDVIVAGSFKWGGYAIPGGAGVSDLTTGSTPVDLAPPFNSVYAITAGGTKGVETINLPAYSPYEEGQIGQTIEFWWTNGLGDGSNPTISYADRLGETSTIALNTSGASQPSDGYPIMAAFKNVGDNWVPIAAPLGQAAAVAGQATLNNPSGRVFSETLGSDVTSYTLTLLNSTMGYYSTTLQVSILGVAGVALQSITPVTNGEIQIAVTFPSTSGGNLTFIYNVLGAPL